MRTSATPRGGELRQDAIELRRAMAVRGLLAQDLCRLAGIAEPTLSGALHGRPVTGTTVGRIAQALADTPPIGLDGIDRLFRVAPAPGQPGAITEPAAPAHPAGATAEADRVSGPPGTG